MDLHLLALSVDALVHRSPHGRDPMARLYGVVVGGDPTRPAVRLLEKGDAKRVLSRPSSTTRRRPCTACRRAGESPRRLVDCLIAAVAIAHDVALLHADADFEVIALHVPLRTA